MRVIRECDIFLVTVASESKVVPNPSNGVNIFYLRFYADHFLGTFRREVTLYANLPPTNVALNEYNLAIFQKIT
jgi:hypothetical protein